MLSYLLSRLYRWIYVRVRDARIPRFAFFDGVRSLIRPLMPTIPITISLVSVTTFFIVFILFSLAFRDKLQIDGGDTANIYALNILESDKPAIEETLTGTDAMYSILRVRISRINGQTLTQYFDTERPSGEFTREFNVTITPLSNKILR